MKLVTKKNLKMKKVLFIALIISAFAYSCNTNKAEEETEAKAMTVEQIVDKSSEFVDKEVVIEGTVSHVCKHGGKKMFLMGENPDVKIKIVPNEKLSSFETDLEGSDVIVTGKVIELKIDEAYLANWESEIKIELEAESKDTEHNIEEGNPKHLGTHKEKKEEATEEEVEDPYAAVNDLRKELKESGKKYLSFYSIECSEFKLK